MDEKQLQTIEKLVNFGQNQNLAIFDELQDISATLKSIDSKEFPTLPEIPQPADMTETNNLLRQLVEKELPEMPSFPNIPEPKETDMTETNNLLRQLLLKEDTEAEPLEVSVDLHIV